MKLLTVSASLCAAIGIAGMASPGLASSVTTTDSAVHRTLPIGSQYAQTQPQARPEFDTNRPLQSQPVTPNRPEFDSNRPLQSQPVSPNRPEFDTNRPLQSQGNAVNRPEFDSNRPLQSQGNAANRPEFDSNRPLQPAK